MKKSYLRPYRKNKQAIQGKLCYNESVRAWNVLRLKKELLEEFTDLKDKTTRFTYEMLLFYDYERLQKHLDSLKEQGEAPPLLFWFKKEEI